mmetsp:Transcript_21668/g.71713  ORF Transcript_21668/g.71713 Transcript_21668/m.71713 type:complete len:141 (+) Transcript_21668:879-1301(+)
MRRSSRSGRRAGTGARHRRGGRRPAHVALGHPPLTIRYDTIMEGVGCDRLTANFAAARIDAAFRVSDEESCAMARRLLRDEGLFVGGSAAMNCVGVLRAAEVLPPGSTIVTVLCDGGQRYLHSVWREERRREGESCAQCG